ncbi:uncharacterized protein PHACADRAFT_74719, partial [Phanerochaete carnosa HHB-10118-sp]
MAGLENNGVYRFRNAQAQDVVMDLSGGDNKSVIGYGWHDGDNQKWRVELVPDDNRCVFIRNYSTGGYLSITENASDGRHVFCTGDPTQWFVEPDNENASCYKFRIPNTNQVLDLSNNGDPTPG